MGFLDRRQGILDGAPEIWAYNLPVEPKLRSRYEGYSGEFLTQFFAGATKLDATATSKSSACTVWKLMKRNNRKAEFF